MVLKKMVGLFGKTCLGSRAYPKTKMEPSRRSYGVLSIHASLPKKLYLHRGADRF